MPHKTRVSQASQIESSTTLERLEKSVGLNICTDKRHLEGWPPDKIAPRRFSSETYAVEWMSSHETVSREIVYSVRIGPRN